MKNIILALNILKKHWVLHLLLCVEIAFSLFFINVIFNQVDHGQAIIKIADEASIENSIYFMGLRNEFRPENDSVNTAKTINKYYNQAIDIAKKSEYFLGASSAQNFSINNQSIQGTHFDKITSERYRMPLNSGVWFTEKTVKEGRIPCVIVDTTLGANTFKVGDVIKGQCEVYDRNNGTKKISEKTAEFEVTGIVDRNNAYVIRLNNKASNYSFPLSNLFPGMYPGTVEILCGNVREEIIPNGEENIGGIIYFNDKMNKSELDKMCSELNTVGMVEKVTDLYQAENKVFLDNMKKALPIFISFLSISFIGLISITLLNTKKQIKTFSIYYICGCEWKRSILIYSLYFIILIGVAFVIYLISMISLYQADKLGQYYLYALTPKNVLTTTTVCVFLCGISTLIPFLNIKKSSLNEIRKVD